MGLLVTSILLLFAEQSRVQLQDQIHEMNLSEPPAYALHRHTLSPDAESKQLLPTRKLQTKSLTCGLSLMLLLSAAHRFSTTVSCRGQAVISRFCSRRANWRASRLVVSSAVSLLKNECPIVGGGIRIRHTLFPFIYPTLRRTST